MAFHFQCPAMKLAPSVDVSVRKKPETDAMGALQTLLTEVDTSHTTRIESKKLRAENAALTKEVAELRAQLANGIAGAAPLPAAAGKGLWPCGYGAWNSAQDQWQGFQAFREFQHLQSLMAGQAKPSLGQGMPAAGKDKGKGNGMAKGKDKGKKGR